MSSPRSRVRGLGADLLAVLVLTAAALGVLFSPLHGSLLAVPLGVLFVLFVPGYAVVAALFPTRPRDRTFDSLVPPDDSPGWMVRVALSLLTSALVVGTAGVLLGLASRLSLVSLTAVITLTVCCGVVVAAVRRSRHPAAERANPIAARTIRVPELETTRQTLTLGLAVVALLGVVAFAGVAPVEGQHYSEAYLLGEGDDGNRSAESYPSTFTAGEERRVALALSNHEYETVSYEVVVVAQTVGPDGTVTAREQLDRFGTTLEHGETSVLDRWLAPTTTGDDIRIRFFVYKGTPPSSDEMPDQTLQFWTSVESAQ